MKVANVNEAIWLESQKKKQMGHFGYGDYGAAVADYIIEEEQSWTDQQLTNAKVKWREMVLNLQNAIRSRNSLIQAIKAMPDGSEKQMAIDAFKEADGTFFSAYELVQPLFAQFSSITGDVLPQADEATFGAIPLAAWAVVAVALTAVTAASAAMYNSKLRYDALLQNPAIAKYDRGGTLFSEIGEQLGSGIKFGLLLLAGVMAFSFMRKK